MKGEPWDYPTRWLVESESKTGDAYVVNLTDPEFMVGGVYNGSCTCRHFTCTLAPKLRNPLNTFIYRCKHLHYSREALVDFMLPKIQAADPNTPEEHQT